MKSEIAWNYRLRVGESVEYSEAMIFSELEPAILNLVLSPFYRPIKPSVIAKKLGLEPEQFSGVRRLIRQLAREGKLVYLPNHLVAAPTPDAKRGRKGSSLAPRKKSSAPFAEGLGEPSEEVVASGSMEGDTFPGEEAEGEPSRRSVHRPLLTGILKRTMAGFGFVRLLTTSERALSERSDQEIFIPAPGIGSAMDGDKVALKTRRGRDGRLEGRILEVLERAKRQFPGTYQVRDQEQGVWLDGVHPATWIRVGDVRGLPIEHGDKVIVEIVSYPQDSFGGEGIIMEVLGNSRNPLVDTIAVMRQFGLEEAFPEEAIEQARRLADAFDENQVEGRRDLRDTPTLTIDPVDARDFDDAISLSRNGKGHWELMVHIADVSAFVPVGTPLDDVAKQRGTSVYLPDRVIPMLPEIISNHLASLQPDRNRLAKTVLMEWNDSAELVHWEVFNSVIRNAQRLNYEQVDQFLEDREVWRERLTPAIWELLSGMHELAMQLRKKRIQNGSIELALPEVKIQLDRLGKVKGAYVVEHTVSHQIIEEFMLAANQTVASWLDDLGVPFLHRVHPMPRREKLHQLAEFVRGMGIEFGESLDRFGLQEVVESVKGTGMEYGINYAILKSMSKAVYQPEQDMHYALNMRHYCHFTSPIRRYPDLQVHRTVQDLIDRKLAGTKEKLAEGHGAGMSEPVLVQLGYHCSDKEQNAESAERELIKIKLLHYASRRIGEALTGTVSTVRPEGLVFRGESIPIEGLIPIESLPEDRYRYDRRAHVIEGHRRGNVYRLGDALQVKIQEVDVARRILLFKLESRLGAALVFKPRVVERKGKKKGMKGKVTRAGKRKPKRGRRPD